MSRHADLATADGRQVLRESFRPNADGSWTVISDVTIDGSVFGGFASSLFRAGLALPKSDGGPVSATHFACGFDVALWLDENFWG